MKLYHLFHPFSVIASVRNEKEMDEAVRNNVKNVFLVRSSIHDVDWFCMMADENDINLFIYFDMIKGLSQDKEAVQFVVENLNFTGIVSNKAHIVKEAMNFKTFAILTLFLLDSYAIKQGTKILKDLKPDAINIAPGVIPKIVDQFINEVNIPVITSGLITEKEEIRQLLDAGATAVSTSNQELWKLDLKGIYEGKGR